MTVDVWRFTTTVDRGGGLNQSFERFRGSRRWTAEVRDKVRPEMVATVDGGGSRRGEADDGEEEEEEEEERR
ncbi:hypothetical protein U1Q18_019461, partial [Sarracenia purpurea var. burkii]